MAQTQTDFRTDGSTSASRGGADLIDSFFAALSRWDAEKFATSAMLVLLVYTTVKNVLDSASKPFWYDELCTVAVAGQPTLAELWRAFHQAQDSNPLFYCLVSYVFRHFAANQEIAYRLPSIVGFACVFWCVFVFVRKYSGGVAGLLCASVLILTPLFRPYAEEARPYAFFTGCIAIALVCYQRAPRIGAMFLMALSLAVAEASHYYAVFAFVPFGLAELVYFLRARHLRWAVWFALMAGLIPLALMWPHLRELQQSIGPHFWGQPSLAATAQAYEDLFRIFAPIALGLAAALCLLSLWDTMVADDYRAPENILAAGFLVLPLVTFVVTKLIHGGFAPRYSIPVLLGLSLSAEHVLRACGRRAALLAALFLLTGISVRDASFWHHELAYVGKVDSIIPAMEEFIESAGHPELPLAISDGHAYMQYAYYATPQSAGRSVGLADIPQSIVYASSDSLDSQMLALRCCLPVHVYEFADFAAAHTQFLLFSDGEGQWDWWPARLAADGYSMQLLVAGSVGPGGIWKMYLVRRNGG